IESRLSRCPGVREAVVVARSDRSGQKSLCGYVAASAEVTAGTLREHLSQTLPGYMIPDTFVFLPELPLTPNGKVDRKALPEPEAAGGPGGFVAPSGEIETAVAEIWQEVLGVEAVGARHDFFALGGHSLSAIQVLTRLRRRFAVDLPLPDFFDDPTIAGLAAAVERLRGTGEAPASGPLRRQRPERLPLSFAQERLWFLDQLQPGNPVYNVPLALQLKGPLSRPALQASLDAVVERHEVLRTTFAADGGRPVQVIHPGLRVEIPVVDLSGLADEARRAVAAHLASREATRPLDLARGPLVRAVLLRLAGELHTVLFTLHHIVADGWSMGVLVREVGQLYTAFSRGERPSLPELPLQYADFTLWQREWLSGAPLAAQIDFWRDYLAGAPAVLDLPFDRPRLAVQRFRGARVPFLLPVDRLGDVDGVRQRHGATRFMVLLAGFLAVLSRWTGQDDRSEE